MNRILVAQQVADAAVHNRPRGNLSDLYPRWLGARELLEHGRNPYSAEITREIQQGYYGRPLDPMRADDPTDQQGFAYPVYVVLLLAPTVHLPFDAVQIGFRWMLVVLSAVSAILWLRVVRWRVSCGTTLIWVVLMLGWMPVVQGIKLQQLTLLVMGLLAACGACLVGGWLFLAGGLLALSTIKPQLTWPLVLWLILWSVSDWNARRRFVFGFGLVMAVLLGGAELVLPGWFLMFLQAMRQYLQYTHTQSVLALLFGSIVGRAIGVICLLAAAACLWRMRGEDATSPVFGQAFALVLALTVVVIPMYPLYNQVLLVPAIMVLARSQISGEPILPAARLARGTGALLLIWPWMATVGLSLAYVWITPHLRARLWPMPFYSSFMVPVFIFGLALLDTRMTEIPGLRDRATAE